MPRLPPYGKFLSSFLSTLPLHFRQRPALAADHTRLSATFNVLLSAMFPRPLSLPYITIRLCTPLLWQKMVFLRPPSLSLVPRYICCLIAPHASSVLWLVCTVYPYPETKPLVRLCVNC